MSVTRTLPVTLFRGVRADYPDYTATGIGYIGDGSYPQSWTLNKWDLTDIPSNATILSAKIRFYYQGITSGASNVTLTVYARRITSSWGANVTWNTKPTYTTADQGSITQLFLYEGRTWSQWIDITTIVSQWVNNTNPNYGIALMTNSQGYVDHSWYTELEITYVAPAGVEVTSPNGTSNNPTTYTDKVSGFSLTGRVEAQTNDPLKEFDAQIYDPANNLGWETAVKYNILSNNQISVETDTTGFTSVGGATLSRNTNNAFHGAASLQVAVTNANAAGVSVSVPATPGEHYSARVRLRADSGTPALQMQLRIKDTGGTVLVSKAIPDSPGRVLHSGYALTTGVCLPPTNAVNKNLTYWQIWEIEDVEAPYNAATVEIWITTAWAQTATWYVDLLELQPNADLLPLVITGSVSVTVPANIVKYGQVYAWRCKAINIAGDSGWTPLAYFKCVMSKEGTPTLVAVPAEGLIRLALASHPAENLAGYRVYRRKAGETDWQKLIDLATNTTVDDEVAASGQSYQYQVATVATDGYEGPASDAVQGFLSVADTFVGDLPLELRLDRLVRPFVGRVSPVLGSGYPDVQGQTASRQYRLEGWVQGTDLMRQLEAILAPPNRVRYLDPWGEAFYFQVMGEMQMEKWPNEDLYHWQVEIAEVS